jgi:ribosome-associated heat shock protein Hsp15
MTAKNSSSKNASNSEAIRLDKWLWAARFFKTRQLASTAIKSSKVSLNGKRTKPAAAVNEGDVVSVRKGPYQTEVQVQAVSAHRGSASIAQTLYSELEESIEKRKTVKEQLASQPRSQFGGRKPDKHTVRQNRAVKRQY